MTDFWEKAQDGERNWWGNCVNTWDEEQKQYIYAEKMGLEFVDDPRAKYIDMQGKSILDIGGGPASLLLKCKNFSKAKVADPMAVPEWVIERYKAAGIEYEQVKGEDIDEHGWDEVWIYNVLLHTESPESVVEKAKTAGGVVRIFEWINTVRNDMHPHVFSKEQLDEWLDFDGIIETISYGLNCETTAYYGMKQKTECDLLAHGNTGMQGSICPAGQSGAVGEPGILRRKRFHLLGLPHVPTKKGEVLACAFTQKVIKMAKMLKSLGHIVYFYGVEGSEVECDEFIQVSTMDVLERSYGKYDMKKETYRHDVNSEATKVFNITAVAEIQKRMTPDDFLLIPFSPQAYQHITDSLETPNIDSKDKLHLVVESGIGYRGAQCRYRVYESYAQMQYDSGLSGYQDGSWYHAVIPNYFDPDDFTFSETKQDSFLYLGRIILRKGISVAIRTVEEIGGKLIVAGQQAGEAVNLDSPCVEYVGFADEEKRRELLSGARALFLPTQYFEPFGGTIIEAAFSGTPVITSDWGSFPELVDHGKTGYRCRTLDHFVYAANHIDDISPETCYQYAMNNFSLDVVQWMYEEYFNMLLDVKENQDGKGWKRLHPERTELDWLFKVR